MLGDNITNIDNIDPDINHYNDNISNFKPHSIDSFIQDAKISNNSLNIFHNNARSIMKEGRLEEYDVLLEAISNPFHIMVFTETWLTEHNKDLCQFDGYKPLHLLRPVDEQFDLKSRGGGVSFFIKHNIDFKYREDLSLSTPETECIFIELTHNNKKYLIGGVYRVPNTDVKTFCQTINNIIEPHRSYEIILLGDFNICLLQDNCHKQDLQNVLQSNSLCPTILAPTRVASTLRDGHLVTTNTLIDNIFMNTQNNFQSGTLEVSISDHYPIFIALSDHNMPDPDKDTIIQYRLINDTTIRKFKYALENSLELNNIYNTHTGQLSFKEFITIFNKLYDQYFPIKSKKLTRKGILKPWINITLISRMKIRDNLSKLAKRSIIDKNIYTEFRNLLTTQIRNTKAEYYSNKFRENEGNIKETWRTINSTIKPNSKQNNKIKLKENINPIDNKDVPNKLKDFFTGIAEKLTSELPIPQQNASHYLKNRIYHTFFMQPVIINEVLNAVNGLKNNGKSANIVSTLVLKENINKLSEILTHIFNNCISDGYFPNELKTGCITPIYKSGIKTEVNNYRPVCSLSPFSKIFERIIYNRMIIFIEQNQIFSKTQFGFRSGLSTESALANFIDKIHNGLNKRHHTVAIFMDLSKAFDVLDHSILAQKLEHYGFRGKFLELIQSFISNRHYFVSANGIKSDTKMINIGVPQGSTLGPLLFLIYINDMCNSSSILEILQFADDTTLTLSGPKLNTLTQLIETELGKVLDWLLANKLIINLTKTHTMLFTNKREERSISIRAHNTILEQKSECKFLGIIVDEDINWKKHINYISNKISKTIAILRLLKYTFPKHILKTLYMSLIQPYLNYCNIIWGAADKTTLEPLIILQKKAIRIINRVHYLEHTEPLFTSMKILTLTQTYKLNCIMFIYKCLYTDKFICFKNKMKRNSEYHNYNTRNSSDYRLPGSRLKQVRQSFFYNGLKLWNDGIDQHLIIYIPTRSFKVNQSSFKRTIKAKIITKEL